jgi:hypothetical protein
MIRRAAPRAGFFLSRHRPQAGIALATSDRASAADRALGRGLVRGMPVLLKLLGVIGTAAMIWVGGGIILHGVEVYGPPAIGHVVKAAAPRSWQMRCRPSPGFSNGWLRLPSRVSSDCWLAPHRFRSQALSLRRHGMAEAFSAPPSEQVRSVRGRLFATNCAHTRFRHG